MEVVDARAAILSNLEVYSLLQDIQSGSNGQKKPSRTQPHLATITYSTLKYLENTPCKDQSAEIVQKFMKAVESFNLTKAEKLQLLNQRPTSAVEIQLIIEESEERLTEDQIEQLLDLVASTLPESSAAESESMQTESS